MTRQGLLIQASAWLPGYFRQRRNIIGCWQVCLVIIHWPNNRVQTFSYTIQYVHDTTLSVEISRTFLPCINKRIWDLADHEWVIPPNPNSMLVIDCLKEFDHEVNEFIFSVSSRPSLLFKVQCRINHRVECFPHFYNLSISVVSLLFLRSDQWEVERPGRARPGMTQIYFRWWPLES